MRRHVMRPRADWLAKAEAYGFTFHTAEGAPYWDEGAAWSFTLAEIEDDIEAAAGDLEELCLAFLRESVDDDEVFRRLAIPRAAWPLIRESWRRQDRNLYGRFDLAYRGDGPAKLLEYNADTPTSVFEAAVFQWDWLEDGLLQGWLPAGSDQFSSLHERLVSAFRDLRPGPPRRIHFAWMEGAEEDRVTVTYLADCARQAGHDTVLLPIEQLGASSLGRLVDQQDRPVEELFKLYPWEWLFREDYAPLLHGPTRFIEPPWKALLSTKGLLPYLWRLAPGHPNLLPAYFADEPGAVALGDHYVEKPLFGREGANVRIVRGGAEVASSDGLYGEEGHVRQAIAELARTGADGQSGGYMVVGAWVVASKPAGMGLREAEGPITGDAARFVPHWIEPSA